MLQLPELKIQARPRQGVTLVEILIVSTIIAVMAALSFPVYKIIQQREKERKLDKFLENFRAAIHGCQANNNNRNRIKNFQEGYKGYILQRGISQIEDAHPLPADKATLNAALKTFIDNAIENGLAYPETVWHLTPLRLPHTVVIATGPAAADTVSVIVEHPFLRSIPPNPFQDWYPGSTWTFKYIDTVNATGVMEIRSSGAGYALNGENTNDW
jgi:prepilin-type N-terminal cleavage/methylation domain-containing protein